MSQVTKRAGPQRQSRSRKPHRKSRTGCVNCRFRRVKCSEERPSCQHCQDYRVSCSYDGNSTDLTSFGEQVSGQISIVPTECAFRLHPVRNPSLKTHINDALMYRFKHRTVYTFGTPETAQLYLSTVSRLAVDCEYLRHAVYATTLVHDRALSVLTKPSVAEAYYLNQAAKIFNQKLTMLDYQPDEKDALWATAVYLCVISASSVNSEIPAQVWPLNETQSSYLNWLYLQRGLRTIWSLTQMGGRCTAISSVERRGKYNCAIPDDPEPGVEGVPRLLRALYELDENSTPSNHPYHAAVQYLTILLPIRSTLSNTLKMMIFAGGMTDTFQTLLQQKDPLALLLMALWYTKLFKTHWYVSRRAAVECRSIYQYLEHRRRDERNFEKAMSILHHACSDPGFDVADSLLVDTDPCDLIEQTVQVNGPASYKVDMFWW